jgi:hypothetical protein
MVGVVETAASEKKKESQGRKRIKPRRRSEMRRGQGTTLTAGTVRIISVRESMVQCYCTKTGLDYVEDARIFSRYTIASHTSRSNGATTNSGPKWRFAKDSNPLALGMWTKIEP